MASLVIHEPLEDRQLLESALAELESAGDLCVATRSSLLAAFASSEHEHASRPYARRTLLNGRAGEAMLATWSPHVRCAPHDHGSAGVVLVVAGRFHERSYDFDERRLIERASVLRLAGTTIVISPSSIHDMECTSDHGSTLHLYLPASQPMRLYDVANRATVIAGEGEGAWLPAARPIAVSPWLA